MHDNAWIWNTEYIILLLLFFVLKDTLNAKKKRPNIEYVKSSVNKEKNAEKTCLE